MFKNRFTLFLAALSMLVVTLAVSQPFSKPSKTVDLSQSPRPVVVPVTGPEADQPYIMDSGTLSYIAWGEALEKAKLNALDSGTLSYIAWGQAMQARNATDSGTRSYIAWAKGAEAEASMVESATHSYIALAKAMACNVDATYGLSLESATQSYIAWGLALPAKNDIGALCR